ncbi:MAG: threonine--tRNA ligase [Candidatus Colwellbacteria bacterium CG10_big_fil_rev_8_21_14_0_10_41_28]|uniref:Threonine--tRNA ligase n=1 Tax=Candidatus Colwellbacteria bacterium CG10_big_fil_rev_8_21_14_0_10_41_28 TaxID=1974539 RepID=A0A2H0VHH6_9BACT|nr:MAG: threonine--tRNA ligase [Candidatus Colwellbacteria bacterium CG10_big_fil_rev_8_21_14_0_10_41_28]
MPKSGGDRDIESKRHTLAHLLAAAVLEKFPKAKLGMGPAVEDGFYYDFDLKESITPQDLPKLEKRMRQLIRDGLETKGEKISSAKAKTLFKDQPYKLELIKDFSKDKKQLTVYKTGEVFKDLCRGGHTKKTSEINPEAFRLTRLAGAYWKGDEKNKQLQRVYGVAFETKKELEGYLEAQEEAKRRDHRRLGQELDLFTFSDMVGAGLPLFTPKGTVIRNELQKALLEISSKYDMLPTTIPHIAKRVLYETSGHADKFGDELIDVKSHYDEFVMKPVNCPHHTQIYASRPRSYRDLPLRYMESTMQYRDEKPGEISGLTRVRAITVDDGHIFCRVDQIEEEAKNIAKIIEEFYKGVGLWGDHWVSLSVRDPKNKKGYIGSDQDWDKAEKMLAKISKDLKLDTKRIEGEAAIYGPKLDYMFKDSLGREFQLATIQIDFAMPGRFKLTYTDEKGKEVTPVIIHRAILGSYERFMAILIEHFAGAFPTWLSPVQVRVLAVSEKFQGYAKEIAKSLKEANIRTELTEADETLGKRIRESETSKVPYTIIVGEKEKKNKEISVRERGKGDIGSKKFSTFLKSLRTEIDKRQ